MALNHVTLDDKYDLTKSRIFVTGFQAIVRLCLMQKERDRRAGLNTAGYVTGYRGSPLGTLDLQFIRAQRALDKYDVRFQAGVNEDIAATAIWGSQQAELRGEGKFDGVFGLWYGKGPGVDRTGDVFRHANFAGTSKHGGVLALMGDDHTAESSTTAHQSEYHFIDVMIPILNPAGVQEILDYGLYGWAMSRFCGSWVALKSMHETVELTAVIDGSLERVNIVMPQDFAMPEGGLNIRLRDTVLGQEARLHDYKRDAMLAFVRANKLNKYITSGGRRPKIGIITVGKSYLDVRQALDELGIDEVKCNDLGIRLYKIGCPWPISRDDLKQFADGLELIIVVEEKRSLIEVQVREELYGTANQPVCIGKKDERGNWLFPVKGALDPNEVAICIGERILQRVGPNDAIAARVAALKEAQRILAETQDVAVRIPYFCSGCPHNSSTVVPEGMRAYAGIGCHYMAQWMDRSTLGFTQMGGEGANWIGEAPFSKRPHVFQNLGDGTYNHSGYMAIRGAIASGVNITYKILFNDAVAMTGGQANDGGLTVPQIARQVAAEGAKHVVVVTDEPWKYSKQEDWPRGLTIHHRDELITVQQELAKIPGVTVLIYDQTCAAEKRRRRKRGLFPDPDKRVVINELVCEGCGDCGVKSNCVSVQPLETEWGRKRTIDQSSCNKDFSCVKGFCPSFVTVHGGKLKQGTGVAAAHRHGAAAGAHAPGDRADLRHHRDRRRRHRHRHHRRHPRHGGASRGQGRRRARHGRPRAEGRRGLQPHAHRRATGGYPRHPDRGGRRRSRARRRYGGRRQQEGAGGGQARQDRDGHQPRRIPARRFHPQRRFLAADRAAQARHPRRRRPRQDAFHRCHAGRDRAVRRQRRRQYLSGRLCLPARCDPARGGVDRAARSSSTAKPWTMNKAAFEWGRRAAVEPAAVEALVKPAPEATSDARTLSQSFDEMVARRVAFLTAYQNAAYAARYRRLVEKAQAAEAARAPGKTGLADAVARYLFKLMAYKDEYEVARLYSDGAFVKQVNSELGGEHLRFHVHLAPPLLARTRQGDRRAEEDDIRPVDFPAVRRAREIQVPARHRLRSVRLFDRAQDRAARWCAITRLCSTRCCAKLDCRQPPHRGGARGHSGKNPRLRPRQAAPPQGGEGRRSGAARSVPRGPRPAAQGRGIAVQRRMPLRHWWPVAANRRRRGTRPVTPSADLTSA